MISIVLIANAGVLIRYRNLRILLDGIQSEGNFPFSKTPPYVLSQMFTHSKPRQYNDIEYLIFSHLHPDHFSPDIVSGYLKCNRVKRILFPAASDPRMASLAETLQQTNTPAWTFEMKRGRIHQYRLTKDISLTTLCTQHMPQLFPGDLCNCLLFQIADKNILFLTDCSCQESELLSVFEKYPVHMAFVNPYFYYDAGGRDLLRNQIRPEQTVIYHLPFPEDDKIRLRALARQTIKKNPDDSVILLEEPFQTLYL